MKKENIQIVTGDITTLPVDVIVNAANQTLLGGGGVDGAIHRAAGPELLLACASIGGINTGEVVITPAFALNAKFIIHTVGPVWRGGNECEPNYLAECYKKSVALALKNNCQSIAFPCISSGVYGYPIKEAARIAIASVMKENISIALCCFDRETTDLYLMELNNV